MLKKSISAQLPILCVLLLNMFIQSEINSAQKLSSAQRAEIAQTQDIAEILVKKAFSALQRIENKLTELALLSQKGLFANISNTKRVMQILTINKTLVNGLLNNQATIMALKNPMQQLETAFLIVEFCNAFSTYLIEQIKNSFKDSKPFDMNRFMNTVQQKTIRSNMNHIQPPVLAQNMKKCRIHMKMLNTVVENVGLTWYNKVARKVDKWVVTPAQKYYVPTITMYTVGAGLIGLYAFSRIGFMMRDGDNMPKLLNSFMMWLYGPRWQEESERKEIEEKRKEEERQRKENKKNGVKETEDEKKKRKKREKKEDKELSEKYKKSTNNAPISDNGFGPIQPEPGSSANNKPDGKFPRNSSWFAAVDYLVNKVFSNQLPILAMAGASFYGRFLGDRGPGTLLWEKLTQKVEDYWNFLRGGEYLKKKTNALQAVASTRTFDDMVGMDEVKMALYPIVQYIDNPEQLTRIEASPEKGWLLTGPPRTGKSFAAECLSGEIRKSLEKRGVANDIKFFPIGIEDIKKYGIEMIMSYVQQNAPAVIFIDEIDLLGLTRHGVAERERLITFLTSMQSSMNADPSKVVIVIAATNNPQNVDKALRQNGRFGKEIRFDYPSRKYRIEFILRKLKNMAVDIKQFDVEALADRTNGKTFEDLESVIRNAVNHAWLYSLSLNQQLLEEFIDRELYHIIPFDRKDLPEKERRVIAAHFAGKALVALHVELLEELDKITIHAYMPELKDEIPSENYKKRDEKEQQKKIEYGTLITKIFHDTISIKNRTMILNEVIVLLAGFVTEELVLGSCGYTCHEQDHEKAYKMVESLVFGAIKPEILPKKAAQDLKAKAYALFEQCKEEAKKLLEEHKDSLNAIIDELLVQKTLDSKQIQAIIDKVEKKPDPVPIAEVTDSTSAQVTDSIEVTDSTIEEIS